MKRALGLLASTVALALTGHAIAADVSTPHPGLTLAKTPDDALVVADLCADGVSVRATRYDERQATPSAWAAKGSVQAEAAVNADFFDFPGWTLVNGRARGAGEDWPSDKMFFESRWYWQFGPNLAGLVQADLVPLAAPAITEIVGGHNLIVAGGASQAPGFDGDAVILSSHRRTAVGLSADKRYLYLFVSNASRSGAALADAMLARAAEAGFPQLDAATNMDGGGSSQMYVGAVGPIFQTGRQVNNHLGVLAKGSGPAPQCPFAPPVGWLDSAGCETVEGWAQGPSAPSASVGVVLAYDGKVFEPGAKYQTTTANVYRDDLCKALGSCEHGFRAPTPYGAMDGATHAVFAYGGNPNPAGKAADLAGTPKSLGPCAPPTPSGRARWVSSESVLLAWKFSTFVDQLTVSDAVFAGLVDGEDLADSPALAKGDDGAPEVWLLDRGVKRHVPSPAAFEAWHFEATAVVTRPAAELAAIPTGTPLRARPMLLKASGPKVVLVDDPLESIGPSGAGGATGVGSGGAAPSASSAAGGGGPVPGATANSSCLCTLAGGARSEPRGVRAALLAAGLACLRRVTPRRRRAPP